MKLDKLRNIKKLKLIIRGYNATSILNPMESLRKEDFVIEVENTLTYGIFLLTGNGSSTQGNLTTELTEQLSMVVFAPRMNNGWTSFISKWRFEYSNLSADASHYGDIFGNVGELVCYKFTFGYERCMKISVGNVSTLYPNVTTSPIDIYNTNLLIPDIQIICEPNENDYYFPLFVDINITRNSETGNILTDIQYLKNETFSFNLVSDVNLITGQISTEPNLSGDVPAYNRYVGNQFFSGFMKKITDAPNKQSYVPYVYPEFNYDVLIDYNTGLMTFSYTCLHPNNIVFPTTISLDIDRVGSNIIRKELFKNTDRVAGYIEVPFENLIGTNYAEITPKLWYKDEYVGLTKFVVAPEYDTSVNLAETLNVLEDNSGIPTFTLKVRYVKKRDMNATPS